MAGPSRIIAGAMSGTSADGVDVALTRIDGRGLDMSAKLLGHHHRAYTRELCRQIHRLRARGAIGLDDLAQVGREISLCYAAAVNEALLAANLSAADLAAVAAHGQTLFHAPPLTIQWLDPALLAGEVGCPVVSDFRRADCAAGGQGAPLVPFADYILFRDAKKNRVLLNIGGIANLTYLPAGESIDKIIAFDTGPGNCISDHLMRKFDSSEIGYDEGGARALRGQPSAAIVDLVLQQDYFSRPPPKSTDGPEMIRLFERAAQGARLNPDDLLATACRLTGLSIHRAAQQFLPTTADQIIFSGGGPKNAAIMNSLHTAFDTNGKTPPQWLASDELGVPSAAKEALAFALLGAATLDGVPSNVPSATGARRAVVLGSITPKP